MGYKKKYSIEKGQYHKYSTGKGFSNGKPLKSYIGEGFRNIKNIPMEFLVLLGNTSLGEYIYDPKAWIIFWNPTT